MKRILILIIGLIGVAQAQYSPTSAKSRFVNGLALGTKLDSYFNAADSNAIYWRADSVIMAKYKGTARALAFAVSGGYLPISDTAAMLAPYRRTSTKITNSDLTNSTISGIALGSNLASLTNGYGISGSAYNGGTAQTWRVDTSVISTKANVTGALVAKLNIYDTSAMLSGYKTYYPRTAISAGTGISYNAATGVITNSSPSSGGTVTSVATGVGLSGGTITTTGTIAADTTTLATRAYAAGLDVAKANTSLNNVNGVLGSNYGGAGIINGILKANGSGVVSAAVNNSDFTLLNGTGFVRMSGTTPSYLTGASSQFVKADGSLDGNTYATTGALSGYLPLTAGSSFPLSGALRSEAVNGIFQNIVSGTTRKFIEFTNDGAQFYAGAGGNGASSIFTGGAAYGSIIGSGNNTEFGIGTNAIVRYSISGSGNHDFKSGTATFGGAQSGTSLSMSGATQLATSSGRVLIKTTTDNGTDALQVAGSGLFSGSVTVGTAAAGKIEMNQSTGNPNIEIFGGSGSATVGASAYYRLRDQTNSRSSLMQINANGGLDFWFQHGGTFYNRATIDNTGAATFSSSVTANGGVIAKGITNDNTAFALDATNSSGSSLFKVRNDGAAIYSSLTGSGIRVVTSSSAGQLAATLLYTTAETASTLAQRDGSGALTATGFVVSSDLRFKDIITQDGDLYQYTLKADEEKKIHYGYIAQEVEKTLPFAVTTNSEGYKAVNYIEVHAIKIRELEKQIQELKKLIKK